MCKVGARYDQFPTTKLDEDARFASNAKSSENKVN